MGKGLGHGYGTSEWRTYTGVTWTRIPTPVEAPMPIFTEDVEVLPEVLVTRLPDPEPEPNGPTEVVWAEGEFARLDGDTIELRDELHFVFGTAELLPDSRPTLAQVSRILNENEDLLHVVIEGHASNEGSYRYNYNLSYARSRSVWEALVEDGVHPDRLSTRGMGEVQPKDGTLEADRRVEFHVVARRLDDAPLPTRTGARLPWNGEPVQ
ncbi:MAG: OmpA family protein [Proteobacteria bacterium]|nr:OmpA family protein [Pseudomonadota bacterium]